MKTQTSAANTITLFANGLPDVTCVLTQITDTGCNGRLILSHLALELQAGWRTVLLPRQRLRAHVVVPGILNLDVEAILVRITDHHSYSELELAFKTLPGESPGLLRDPVTDSNIFDAEVFRGAPDADEHVLRAGVTQAVTVPQHELAVLLRNKRLGEVLVHMGHVTADQIDSAMATRQSGERLGRTLIRLGLVTPSTVAYALALQSGLSLVDLARVNLTDALTHLFPYTVLKAHNFVPFAEDATSVWLAVAEPLAFDAQLDLAQQCGRPVRACLAAEDEIARVLDRLYRERKTRRAQRYRVALPVQYQYCTRLGTPIDDLKHTVVTFNVSMQGFGLDRAPDLPRTVVNVRRQDLYATVQVMGLERPLNAICQLRWVRKVDDGDGTPPHCQIGLEIVDIDFEEQQRLNELCAAAAALLNPQAAPPGPAMTPAVDTARGPLTEILPAGPVTETVPVIADTAPDGRLVTRTVPPEAPVVTVSIEDLRRQLRLLGITEDIFIHQHEYRQFLQEKGIKELGRGGEGAVYFLRGHVVKVAAPQGLAASLREIAHMLHLNRLLKGGALGERARQDWPALLWIYILSNGSLAIGMKPFDPTERLGGATLLDRLRRGPTVERAQARRVIRGIAASLSYAHSKGVIHHDLKPANIFVPGDAEQPPVIFDLGQSIWKNNSWGRDWLRHEHNRQYWYNGTYRYMHYIRRLSQMGAIAAYHKFEPSVRQNFALQHHMPSFYDDVFAFAHITADCLRSPHVHFSSGDRAMLREFSADLMGLNVGHSRKRGPRSGLHRLTSMFQRSNLSANLETLQELQRKWPHMERVDAKLQLLLEG